MAPCFSSQRSRACLWNSPSINPGLCSGWVREPAARKRSSSKSHFGLMTWCVCSSFGMCAQRVVLRSPMQGWRSKLCVPGSGLPRIFTLCRWSCTCFLPLVKKNPNSHPNKQKTLTKQSTHPPKLLVIWTSVLIAHLRSYIQNLQEVQKHFWICCCSYLCSSHPPIAWCLSYKTCMFLTTGLQVLLVSLLKHG